jgi:hypothetical protein
MIEVLPQLNGVAAAPLNVIVLLPCGDPKPDPVTVTLVLTGPDGGEIVVILGGGITVKLVEADCTPTVTVTVTIPPGAPLGTGTAIAPVFQLVGVPLLLPKMTVLEPADCVLPKFEPVIVTGVPYSPVVGDMLAITGAGTVNETLLLLAWPLTVTTTIPVIVLGTVTPMLPGDQDVTLAAAPLKVTELDP